MSMERNIITMSESGNILMPDNIAGIWMSEPELVELFGVIAPTLRATIRTVYKSGVLEEHGMQRYIRMENGYYADVFSFPMIVALAFRINTPSAAQVRNTVLERVCLRKEKANIFFSLGINSTKKPKYDPFMAGQRAGASAENHGCGVASSDDVEDKERILRALKQANGNRKVAAELLGIGRTTLYNKLEEYGLKYKFRQS